MSSNENNGVVARSAKRAVGERSAARHDPPASAAPSPVPDPEFVSAPLQAERRSFTAAYKLRILQEADQATEHGQVAAMLRREGLYSSHLVEWRKARDNGALQALQKPRGRPKPDPLAVENAQLKRRLEHAEQDLQKARKVIAVQGKRLRASGRALGAQGRAGHQLQADHRAMNTAAVEDLAPLIGTRPACRALGAAPATIYRQRTPLMPRPTRPRTPPARKLTDPERAAVLEQLHSGRFVDSSPAQVWATLLDEGTYLASERTMYRLLAEHDEVRERRTRRGRTPRPTTPTASRSSRR